MHSTHPVKTTSRFVAAAIALTFLGAVLIEAPPAHAAIALEAHSHVGPEPPPFASRNGGGATR